MGLTFEKVMHDHVAARCYDLAFLANLTARILEVVADRLLVNIQPDEIADHFLW
jgi:hypothetical protein